MKKVRKRKGNRKKHKRFEYNSTTQTTTIAPPPPALPTETIYPDDKLFDENLKDKLTFFHHLAREMNDEQIHVGPDETAKNEKVLGNFLNVNDNDNVTSNEDKTIQIIVENDENVLKFNKKRNDNDVIPTNDNDDEAPSAAVADADLLADEQRTRDDKTEADERSRLQVLEKEARKRQRDVFREQQLHEKLLRKKRKRKFEGE